MSDPTIAKVPARIKERFGVTFCTDCGLMTLYCRCDEKRADSPSKDGADSGLAKRIREARVRQGGR